MAANLSFLKRLVKEDFASKDQDLISKIAFVLNPALSQIVTILNHGLNISDLNVQKRDITLMVDANGTPTANASFQSSLSGKCSMMLVGRAQNLTNSNSYPTTAPFVSFSDNAGTITILNVTGLQANNNYQLTLVAMV